MPVCMIIALGKYFPGSLGGFKSTLSFSTEAGREVKPNLAVTSNVVEVNKDNFGLTVETEPKSKG